MPSVGKPPEVADEDEERKKYLKSFDEEELQKALGQLKTEKVVEGAEYQQKSSGTAKSMTYSFIFAMWYSAYWSKT